MSRFRSSRYRLAPLVPDLTEIQYHKFNEFLRQGIAPGLHAINPIYVREKNMRVVLYPDLYQFIAPKRNPRQSLNDKTTYSMSLYVPGHVFLGSLPLEKPQWLYLGQLPVMTRRGHFIINGVSRVMVHQILRRPGVYFKEKREGVGIDETRTIWADFICQRGSWVRIQRDKKRRFWFCLKNTPKLDLDLVINAFDAMEERLAFGARPPLPTFDKEDVIQSSPSEDDTLSSFDMEDEDLTLNFERGSQAFELLEDRLKLTGKGVFQFLYRRFKNPKAYTLGLSARYQLNRKLHLTETSMQLTANDLRQTKEYLLDLDQNHLVPDDIDNLSNRRVRTSSEFFQLKLDAGFQLLAKSAQARSKMFKHATSAATLIDTKALSRAFRECFFVNPLAQFLDQVNPLSDITHKRRIYATGPGGVSLDNASLEMRSIHPTYYGRICPIETPEGKKAGLVNSLTVFGRVDKDGSLQTPYYRVFKGQIQKRSALYYMTTAQEQGKAVRIAPLDLYRDLGQAVPGNIPVPARITTELQEDFVNIPRNGLNYIGIAPSQLMSIATSLIPFLEHDDANRALMGSNMQRQTVPVIQPTRPIVSTGLESLVVGESGHALIAEQAGVVSHVSGKRIDVESQLAVRSPQATKIFLSDSYPSKDIITSTVPGFIPTKLAFEEGCSDSYGGPTISWPFRPTETTDTSRTRGWIDAMSKDWWTREIPVTRKRRSYTLDTYERGNQGIALIQRPSVDAGQWVQRGDLLADCAASVGGHLALGHNLFVAYLPWEGYNFEDAVVISERLVFDDLYTTVHVERYDTEAVKSSEMIDGMELVTKDFGPSLSAWEKKVLDDEGIIRVGRWIEPGDIIVRKIMRQKPTPLNPYFRLVLDILQKKPPVNKDVSFRVPRGVRGRVINTQVIERMNVSPQLRAEYIKLGYTNIPETLPSKVRVFIAEKRRIQVGDKVAGRHGNKGIISCILPRQDMPYLPDGREVDMVLNPLGVPSRMNVGQVFECLLGLAGSYLNQEFRITPFDEIFGAEASRSIVFLKLYQARLKTGKTWLFQPNFPGKVRVFDGRTGTNFDQFVTVGCAYMLKLVHLVEEKIHARTIGPYSMLMEQPLAGRAKNGGQRLGEMEVWALEAFGAAYILQEMLTIKSDDFEGRSSVIDNIIDPLSTTISNTNDVSPENSSTEDAEKLKDLEVQQMLESRDAIWAKDLRYQPRLKFGLGTSDAFRVLLRELQSLCLDVGVYALTVPNPRDGSKENYDLFPKQRFTEITEANESELPITSKEIQMCDPSNNNQSNNQSVSVGFEASEGFSLEN